MTLTRDTTGVMAGVMAGIIVKLWWVKELIEKIMDIENMSYPFKNLTKGGNS